jgi:biopolymer transport protein ExbB
MIESLWWQLENVRAFLAMGGPVMWVIVAVAAAIGFLVTERYWFLLRVFPRQMLVYRKTWQQTSSQRRENLARHIRTALVSEASIRLNRSLPLIKTLVAVCPLLGLLGTVTGMIQVFDVVGSLGTGNARAMASGISRATLPTMAGMVVALPGLYFCLQLEYQVKRAVEQLGDRLHFGPGTVK